MLVNAAGVGEIYPSRDRDPDVKLAALAAHPATAAVALKTCTHRPRTGQPHAWAVGQGRSVNAVGLANAGAAATAARARRLVCQTGGVKPVIVSFWGRDAAGAVAALQALEAALDRETGPVWFEWNVSCPNAPRVGVDLAATWHRLACVTARPVGLKVGVDTPPVPAPVPFVTAVNTLRGGHGGRALRRVALAAIRRWRAHLGPHAVVIGVGGCRGAADAAAYRAAGATWVGVGTALLQHGLAALEPPRSRL